MIKLLVKLLFEATLISMSSCLWRTGASCCRAIAGAFGMIPMTLLRPIPYLFKALFALGSYWLASFYANNCYLLTGGCGNAVLDFDEALALLL